MDEIVEYYSSYAKIKENPSNLFEGANKIYFSGEILEKFQNRLKKFCCFEKINFQNVSAAAKVVFILFIVFFEFIFPIFRKICLI